MQFSLVREILVCGLLVMIMVVIGSCTFPLLLPPGLLETTAEVTAAESTLPTGHIVTGTVLFAGDPVPDAIVELRSSNWRTNPDSTITTTVADDSGLFVFENPPVGEYALIARLPGGEDDAGGFPSVTIEAGETITGVTIPLELPLALVEPVDGAQVEPNPLLRWNPFAGAVQYRVRVTDAGTSELMLDELLVVNSVVVTPALEPGRTYQWVVNAIDENNIVIATGAGVFIVAGETGALFRSVDNHA